MDPFDPEPPGGDGRRMDRLLVWAATAGALGCSVLIFLLTNAQAPEPVAEPAPTVDTALPAAASSTFATTATTTLTTTTTVPPTTTMAPPRTTTRRSTTTSHSATTTTTAPKRTPATAPPTSNRRCLAAEWQRDTAYSGGTVVSYGGRLWMAKWWNYNAIPGANQEGVWTPARDC